MKFPIPTEEGKKGLEFLRNADLEITPFADIKKRTDILVRCGFSGGEFQPLKHWIYRGVLVDINKLSEFSKVQRISYRIKKKDDKFSLNRASSNAYEVFYGGIPTPDFDDAKVSAVLEIDTIRDKDFPEDEYEYIAMGLWFVTEPFFVVSLGMHSKTAENSTWARNIAAEDHAFFEQIEESELVREVMQFMADEFGKEVPKGKDHLYKISAAYGDSLFDLGIEAILFPSIQTGAKSFNVALRGSLVKRKQIDIEAAAIMRGSKINDEIFWGWYLQCARVYGDDLKWTEPPRATQIGECDLKIYRKIIEENGSFAQNSRVII